MYKARRAGNTYLLYKYKIYSGTATQQAAYAQRVRSSFKLWNLRLYKVRSEKNNSLTNNHSAPQNSRQCGVAGCGICLRTRRDVQAILTCFINIKYIPAPSDSRRHMPKGYEVVLSTEFALIQNEKRKEQFPYK